MRIWGWQWISVASSDTHTLTCTHTTTAAADTEVISLQSKPLIPAEQLKPVSLLHPIRGCLNSQERFSTDIKQHEESRYRVKHMEGTTETNRYITSCLATYLWPDDDQYIPLILTMPGWKTQNYTEQRKEKSFFLFFFGRRRSKTDFFI